MQWIFSLFKNEDEVLHNMYTRNNSSAFTRLKISCSNYFRNTNQTRLIIPMMKSVSYIVDRGQGVKLNTNA